VSYDIPDPARASGGESDTAAKLRHRRFCVLWATLLLPPFLGAIALIGSATHLRFLLFPPLAAIGYALFLDPRSSRTALRSVVLGPVAGALLGVAAVSWLPPGPARVMIVTALGIVALYVLHAELTPALAVALLTLLVGAEGETYVVSIALSSLALWALFLVWRHTIYFRFYPPEAHAFQQSWWARARSVL
jgi:CBS-domain-containing membrane protein